MLILPNLGNKQSNPIQLSRKQPQKLSIYDYLIQPKKKNCKIKLIPIPGKSDLTQIDPEKPEINTPNRSKQPFQICKVDNSKGTKRTITERELSRLCQKIIKEDKARNALRVVVEEEGAKRKDPETKGPHAIVR